MDLALKIILGIGIPSIIIGLLCIGRKFQILDDLKDCWDKANDKLSDIDKRICKIEGKLFGVAIGQSPIKLTPLGQEVLQNSGILEILKAQKESLIKKIKESKPQTAYDVQETTKNTFTIEKLGLSEQEANRLKNYAFSKGITLAEVMLAGSIYFRDIVLEEMGLKVDDLDKIK
ncbi:MAG: hypothetical protein PHZ04_03315 [Patescibacteria group bacterium]|nr:hypothetical protein [Patescibacteria group bacterium]MDD5295013.1 hypothetical protein [Patescibacteria group bacterium]MDD5554201.1 hypothetical protein [Patescibacteria group bacterium]